MEGPEQEERQTSSAAEQETPPRGLMCKYCGEGPFSNMSKLGIHSRKCEARKQAEKAQKEAKGEPPSPYKGETDVNAILDDILKSHPDISQKIHDEVMDWARLKGLLQPMELQAILMSMRGMSSQTANIIASKYSFAVVKAQQEGKLALPPPVGGILSQPPNQWTFGQLPGVGPSSPFPSPTALPGFPTGSMPSSTSQTQAPYWPPDIRGMIREELERVERSKPKEPGEYVDIEEPVRDSQGSVIIGPDDKPIMRRMHMPASQAGQLAPKEDPEMRVLEKLAQYKKIFGSEITEEKIRQIIKEAAPAPSATTEEKPVTLEDVKKSSAEAAQMAVTKVLEVHEKEDKEEARFKRLEDTIRSTASSKTVEGYKEDSFRILGQGLSEAAGTLKERKPLEVLVREGGPLILGGSPTKEVEAGAGESLLERFKKKGWVVEQ